MIHSARPDTQKVGHSRAAAFGALPQSCCEPARSGRQMGARVSRLAIGRRCSGELGQLAARLQTAGVRPHRRAWTHAEICKPAGGPPFVSARAPRCAGCHADRPCRRCALADELTRPCVRSACICHSARWNRPAVEPSALAATRLPLTRGAVNDAFTRGKVDDADRPFSSGVQRVGRRFTLRRSGRQSE